LYPDPVTMATWLLVNRGGVWEAVGTGARWEPRTESRSNDVIGIQNKVSGGGLVSKVTTTRGKERKKEGECEKGGKRTF